jgi:hypothetical protein
MGHSADGRPSIVSGGGAGAPLDLPGVEVVVERAVEGRGQQTGVLREAIPAWRDI